MNKGFYPRLAAQNLKKNGRFYIPYMLTVAGTVAAFYILCSLSNAKDLPDQSRYMYLSMFTYIGLFVLGLFSVIFLFYTNSFLMKRRGKEIGLYNILGMDKRNIAIMLGYESLFTAILGIGGGLVCGIVLQKLVTMLLYHLMGYNESFHFRISVFGIVTTCILFSVILLLTLLLNLRRIHVQKPIALLYSSNTGEKEPKTRWIFAVLGVLCLGAGYIIAVTTKDALAALNYYFVAVFLVIIGTYCLFTAVSIAVMKLLRQRKSYYYKTANFIGLSGMLYRMKRNAVGLANICILSTMVLVMISGTLSLYLGTEDAMESRFPASYNVNVRYDLDKDTFDSAAMLRQVCSGVEQQGLQVTHTQDYRYLSFAAGWTGDEFVTSAKNYSGSVGKYDQLCFMTAEDYFKLTGEKVELKENEVLAKFQGSIKTDTLVLSYQNNETGEQLQTQKFQILENISSFKGLSEFSVYITDVDYFVVANEEVLKNIWTAQKQAYGSDSSKMNWQGLIDSDGSKQQQIDCSAALSDSEKINVNEATTGMWEWYSVDGRENQIQEMYAMNGGFFFLGIFLGLIFVMATVLIMYYKQISEGYEDRERFQIMQKVGLPKSEIRKSINKQILFVFFAPLAVAAIHVAFDFRLIRMLLMLFQLDNSKLTLLCTLVTVAVFAIVYAGVYALTAKVYYKIVK